MVDIGVLDHSYKEREPQTPLLKFREASDFTRTPGNFCQDLLNPCTSHQKELQYTTDAMVPKCLSSQEGYIFLIAQTTMGYFQNEPFVDVVVVVVVAVVACPSSKPKDKLKSATVI